MKLKDLAFMTPFLVVPAMWIAYGSVNLYQNYQEQQEADDRYWESRGCFETHNLAVRTLDQLENKYYTEKDRERHMRWVERDLEQLDEHCESYSNYFEHTRNRFEEIRTHTGLVYRRDK